MPDLQTGVLTRPAARLSGATSSPGRGLLHGIEPTHDRGDTSRELHDARRGGSVLRRQRFQLQQLRFGEQGRERII